VVGGTNSAIRQIIAPLENKLYVVTNNTSGGYAITIGGVSGSTVTIPNGITAQVYCDGTNFFSSQTGSAGNFTVNGTLSATGVTNTGNMVVGGTLGVTGATTFTGIPSGPTAAAGTNTTQLATTAFVTQNAVLTGTINMWPTSSAPTGYLLCAGAAVSRTTYAALFAVIGTTFGVGDGSTTFTLPNYTNRMPYGTTIGATGGSADAVVVSHTHTATSTDSGHVHNTGFAVGGDTVSGGPIPIVVVKTGSANTASSTANITTTVATAGVSGTNANLPPYLGINFIIKT
jgi:microcystin-dependent protein